MSWCASDPSFDIRTYFDHCRATKPPYSCPYEGCNGKVYRTFVGIQSHIDKTHTQEKKQEKTSNSDHELEEKEKCKGGTPELAANLQASQRGTFTWAQTQKIVEIDIDGRLRPLNIMEPLELKFTRDSELPPDQRSNAVLKRYRESIHLSPNSKPPEAKFWEVEDYKAKKVDALPKTYIRHIEKSPTELEQEVEYDMDEEDYAWLQIMNRRRALSKLPPVSESNFEFLMDRLEKESHFQHDQTGAKIGPPIDEDAECCVCQDGECQNTNVILFCDMCNLAVHQECYGVPYIPEGQWLCRRCQLSPSQAVDCCLCPNRGGAYKQTTDGKWAHVICAIWVPEVHFANTVFLEPIEGMSTVPSARWKLKCIVCKQRGTGACVQCHKPSCYTAFHVTCAQSAGLYMRVEPTNDKSPGGNINYNVRKYVYCDIHAPSDGHVPESVSGKTPREDSKIVAARKEMSKVKMRKARRMLAQNRNSAPSVAIPVLSHERLKRIEADVKFPGKQVFMPRIIAYWTLKRESRFGVPLVRRLQVHYQSRNLAREANDVVGGGDHEMRTQVKQWRSLRQNLERVRILCELVRKREKNKKDYVTAACDVIVGMMKPPSTVLVDTVDTLLTKDFQKVFTNPVTEKAVPGYGKIIKIPMDLSKMRMKASKGLYRSFNDLETDFILMINNCLTFNRDNQYFYKYGKRMNRICQKILSLGRQEYKQYQNILTNKQFSSLLKQAADISILSDVEAAMLLAGKAIDDVVEAANIESPIDSPIKGEKNAKQLTIESCMTLDEEDPEDSDDDMKEKSQKQASNRKRKPPEMTPSRTPTAKKKKIKEEKVASKGQTSIKEFFPPSPAATPPAGVNRRTAVLHSNKKPKTAASSEGGLDENTIYELSRLRNVPARGARLAQQHDPFKDFRIADPRSPVAVDSESSAAEDLSSASDDDEVIVISQYSRGRKGRKRISLKEDASNEGDFQVSHQLDPQSMDQVWAQYSIHGNPRQKYIMMPGLVIDYTKIPTTGYLTPFGAQISAPPEVVLKEQPKNPKEPFTLIRFFDKDVSWNWAPLKKIVQFGLENEKDTEYCQTPKRLMDKKLVSEAYENASYYRYRLLNKAPTEELEEKFKQRQTEEEEAKTKD